MGLIAVNYDLQTVVCWCCGITFAMPQVRYKRLCENGDTFWCPSGCRLSIGESENAKLRKELAATEKQLERAKKQTEWAKKATEQERKSHAATRGHLTRHKKRAKAGVCPCCNRSFENLARHMQTKHPNYDPETVE